MERQSRLDSWTATERDGVWTVVDRNDCTVAQCGSRREDAELIAYYADAHIDLIDALRAALPYLESMYENLQSVGMDFDDARETLLRARTVFRRVCGPPDGA